MAQLAPGHLGNRWRIATPMPYRDPLHYSLALSPQRRVPPHRLSIGRPLGMSGADGEGFFSLDRDGIFSEINHRAAAWLRLEPMRILGRHYHDILPQCAAYFAMREAMDCGESSITEQKSVIWPDRWVETRFYPTERGITVFFRDISARKELEIEAKRFRALLKAATDALSAHVAILDTSGFIINVNESWRRYHREHRHAGTGFEVGDHYLSGLDRLPTTSQDARTLADGLRAVCSNDAPEFNAIYHDVESAETWFRVHIGRFDVDGDRHFAVTYENISLMRRSEKALQRLAGQLLTVQDAARRQVARDLHDTTAQNLLCASLAIQRASSLTPSRTKELPAYLAEATELIQISQNEIRTLSYLLHPPMLDEAGLPVALRWFIAAFVQRTQLRYTIDVSPECEACTLPTQVGTALFRVAQEALTNVHRHSGSEVVHLKLEMSLNDGKKRIQLEVSDEGCGISPFIVPGEHGIGLIGMAERMRLIDGDFVVRRNGAGGTSVVALAPLED